MRYSYLIGVSERALSADTIGDYFHRIVSGAPSTEALVDTSLNIRLSYGELYDSALELARGLIAAGVGHGDRVAIMAYSSPEWVIGFYAVTTIGAVCVAIDPALSPREQRVALSKARPKITLVSDDVRQHGNGIKAPENGVPKLRGHDEVRPNLECRQYLDDEYRTWRAVSAHADAVTRDVVIERRQQVHHNDPALILFTSGTTNASKPVVITHTSAVNSAISVGDRLRYSCSDRVCVPAPLFHSVGCISGLLGAMTHGSTVVLPGTRFDPTQCLRAIVNEKCTAIYGVPSMFASICTDARHDSVKSLRTGIVAGSLCSPVLMDAIIDRLGVSEITTCYGLTETRCISQSLGDEPRELRRTTVGWVHPHVSVKIVDTNGRMVPVGVAGEILTRGFGVMKEYFDDEELTRRAVDDRGWFRTGDIGVLHENGYVSLVGRAKDIIIRGGENIHPSEIESVLSSHQEILQACVVGVPDERYGEELCALIRLRTPKALTDREVRRFCRERLSFNKIPRHVLFAGELPSTPSGKVQRYRVALLARSILSR